MLLPDTNSLSFILLQIRSLHIQLALALVQRYLLALVQQTTCSCAALLQGH